MANQQSAAIAPMTRSNKAFSPMLGALAIAAALFIALLASCSSDDADTGVALTKAQIDAGAVPAEDQVEGETGPVEADGSALPPLDPSTEDPAIGKAAPVLDITRFDGTEEVIDPADGTGRVFSFVAHWCPHCQREVPVMTQWLHDTDLPSDIQFVVVSTGVQEGQPNYPPSEWLHNAGLPALVVRDDAIPGPNNTISYPAAVAYGLGGYPYFVVTDGTGKVVYRTSGEQTVEQLADMVKRAQG